MSEKLSLTRRQVLSRQIDSAIWLLRVRREPVVANMIAHAAIDVMRSLAKNCGARTFKGSIEVYIKPEKLKEYRYLDRLAYNFAKHADRDPAAELEDFNPVISDYNVLASVIDFGEIFKTQTPFMLAFRSCELAKNQDILEVGDFKEQHRIFDENIKAVGNGHDDFCRNVLLFMEENPHIIRSWPQNNIEPTEMFGAG